MNKFLKWALIVLACLTALALIGFQMMKSNTKKASQKLIVRGRRRGKHAGGGK